MMTSRVWIGWGDAGVRDTLSLMSSLVEEGLQSFAVIEFARMLAVRAGVRRPIVQALAIQTWLKRVWRFVDDERDADMLADPQTLLAMYDRHGIIAGDCDEAAILGATLARAIGFRAQFIVYGFPSSDPNEADRFSHVFTAVLTDDGQRISLDVTRPRGPVPAPSRVLTVEA